MHSLDANSDTEEGKRYSETLNYNHNFTSFCYAGDQPAIVNIPVMVAERVTLQHDVEEVVDILLTH